jgi:hypothetical protein
MADLGELHSWDGDEDGFAGQAGETVESPEEGKGDGRGHPEARAVRRYFMQLHGRLRL